MKKLIFCLAFSLFIVFSVTTLVFAANSSFSFGYGLSGTNLWVDASSKNNKVYTDRGFVVHVDGLVCDVSTYGVCFNSVKYSGNSDLIISSDDYRIEGNNKWTRTTGTKYGTYRSATTGYHCIASRADFDSAPGTIYSVSGTWNSDT